MLLMLITPSFSSPILEENTLGMRNDTFKCTQPLLNCSIETFKSINLNHLETLLLKQFCDSSRH